MRTIVAEVRPITGIEENEGMKPTDPPGSTYIVHPDPAERRETNYVAQVDLAPFGLDGQFEQLWLHDLGEGAYALACVPFMLYGLALGDVVRLTSDGVVAGLVQARGHRVLRLLMADDSDTERLTRTADEIRACVAESGLPCEWNGPRFIAVDVPPDTHPEAVFAVMGRIVNEGRGHWEWGDARPFDTP